jgi:tetratricopeptide (TPR) repeat protein
VSPEGLQIVQRAALAREALRGSGNFGNGCAQVTYDSQFQYRGSFAMTKTTALWTLTLLVSLSCGAAAGEHANRSGHSADLTLVDRVQAPPQAAAAPQWKSREEYDAFNAMTTEKDPNKKISLADAFLQKFPTSDFKSGAYLTEMQVYFQLNKSDEAVDAGKKVLGVDPDNLDALAFLSYVFPFTFKATDPDATAKLSRADSDAHHGLDVLQKFQKPANATDEQFKAYVNPKRAIFNSAIGFVALQRKDYANSITALKAADADNPSDVYAFYRLGLAYIYSTPPDYDHALWYIARAVSLAQAAKNPAGDDINTFLKRAYVNYHGNDQGLADILTQTAASVNPPDGFKVEAMKVPEKTGDANKDAYNEMTFALKLGGEKAQKTWDALKGQPLGLAGFVDSVVKSPDAADTYLVRIDILEPAKSQAGLYDIEVKDTSQPKVTNLSPGDPVRFKGTLTAYTATPSLVLSVDGTIDPDTIPDEPKAKAKPTTHHPTHKATTPSN